MLTEGYVDTVKVDSGGRRERSSEPPPRLIFLDRINGELWMNIEQGEWCGQIWVVEGAACRWESRPEPLQWFPAARSSPCVPLRSPRLSLLTWVGS